MTTNVKNQQQDQNKIIEKGWIVKLPPIFATLIPAYEQDANIIDYTENYVDIIKFRKIELELQQVKNKLKE
ncbi:MULTISPECIES: hypothetical protein [spotted fever group]|uniref:Uncharacterized protein n=1 Tax=Rickettsia tamurae subsp. buchneri TaxID=1462938 RepID=A0A8E0WLI3_9RICK|nr:MULTISPECIES: hypothetical protein [spotted fever group]KDO02769.1 hypothetical protein REISMN_05235 [Rickettsia tamurae subsp. buchneri]